MRLHAFPPFISILLLLLVILAPSHTVASSEAATLEIAYLSPFESIDSGVDAESFGPHTDFSSSGGVGGRDAGVGVLPGGPPSMPRVAQLRGTIDGAATQASSGVAAGDNLHVARLYLLSKKNSRARCLDGSPAGYYLRRGFGSGANNWIMILEDVKYGGVGSTDSAVNPAFYNWNLDVKYGGVGSTDSAVNPAFYNWNLVLVKYCDGSSFTGGYGKLPPNAETGRALYFRGHWSLQGTLQDLLARHGLNVGKQMLVGGCSAGGVATSIKCDQISRWLANYNVTTKCFMDGGYFPDVADKDGQYSMRQKVQQMAGVHDMGRIGVNAECKRVQKKLAAASTARAAVAKFLIKVSSLHKEALRIWTGMAVLRSRENVQGLMFMKAVAECLGAGLLALVLLPLHLLAEKLVYTKVKAAIGIKKAAVSGGGSLPSHVDKFFEALGSIGSPVPGTEIKIVDLETGAGLPAGQRGLVKARGPQVMKGYYKNPVATTMAIDKDGWFSTGDLGWISPLTPVGAARNSGGLLVLDGRAKDTIDERKLGALIVVNEEEMEVAVASMRAEKGMEGGEVTEKEQRTVVRQELTRCLTEAGCLPHERIGPFALLDEPFTVDNGLLTATMKMRRDVIYSSHKELCDQLFQHQVT
ncbi:unnamed protein product [Closterium sp. NIES-64]|nr:unnamed protein product [Closterium sp. NIES-64]